MANRTDALSQLAELFNQEKCYTIDELSRRLNYSLISIRRFLKVMDYYAALPTTASGTHCDQFHHLITTVFGFIETLGSASMAI